MLRFQIAGSGQTRDVGDLSAKVLPLESRKALVRPSDFRNAGENHRKMGKPEENHRKSSGKMGKP